MLDLYEVENHDIYIAEDAKQVIRMHREMYPDNVDMESDVTKIPREKILKYDLASIGGEGIISLTAQHWTFLISKPQHLMQYEW